jgi:mannitol 2-dehydrogenase
LPDSPKTVFGLIIAGLKRRKLEGNQPFTVLSCDNIPHNGDVARQACVQLAVLSDPTLAKWIDKRVSFPNGMVDRITPSTGQKEREICATNWGILDGWPIFCERFSQWIVEDKFPSGRPALES